jgi:hypothetical protein
MKSLAVIVFGLLSAFSCFGQKPLTPEAQKVKDAYEWMLKQPNFPENHIHFIESFPENKDDYITTFTPHTFDQLYFNYDAYIAKYRELGKMYPRQVMAKSIAIGKQLHTATGPASIMQETIMDIANTDPKTFAREANKLKKKDKTSLVYFLADVPDHDNYTQYNDLVKALENSGEAELAEMLIAARDERMKQAQ